MTNLLSLGLLPVALTLFAYLIGAQCQKKFKLHFFTPILIGVIVVLMVLSVTGLERKVYQEGGKY